MTDSAIEQIETIIHTGIAAYTIVDGKVQSQAARAIAALIAEAREAGRREGLEEAAKGCDWVAATHRQTEKDAMDYGASNSAATAGEIADLFEERANAIRALATEASDAE